MWASHAPTRMMRADKDFRGLNKSAIKERATTAHVSISFITLIQKQYEFRAK